MTYIRILACINDFAFTIHNPVNWNTIIEIGTNKLKFVYPLGTGAWELRTLI